MKKLLKIGTYFIIIVIVLSFSLTIIAKLLENKIADLVLIKLSENIEAPLVVEDVSFSLLRKFPLATIELENVLLGVHNRSINSDSVIYSLDTIISITNIYVSVRSKPLLKGIFEIKKVKIDGAKLNYLVDTNGVSNIDFLIAPKEAELEDTTPSNPIDLTLTDLSLKNIDLNFIDQKMKAAANVFIPELKIKGKLKGENIIASAKGKVSLSNCIYGATNLHLMKKTNIDFDADYENDSITIKELDINTDGAKLNIVGDVILGNQIKTNVNIVGTELILGELIKYAPEEMLKEFGVQHVSGILNLNATINGFYSESEMPKVDLKLDLVNGNIKIKDYPNLKNIAFKGDVTNGILKNNQSSQASFSLFHFETEKSQFDFAFSVLDIDHPKYNVEADLSIDINEFRIFIPDSIIQNIDGDIKASIFTKGEFPDSITDDFVDYIMANSRANIQLKDINVDMASSMSIKNFSTRFVYKPNNFAISNLNIDIPTYNFELRNTSFNTDFYGSINNTSELKLNIKDYHIETKGAEISGFLRVENLKKPSYETETKIKINLEETISIMPANLLKQLTGNVAIDIYSKATFDLDSIADQAIYAAFNNSIVNVDLKNVTAIMADNPLYKIENLNGQIKTDSQEITINKMSGFMGGIEFGIDSTTIENIYKSVIKNEPEKLVVNTRLSLGDLDYAMLALFMATDSTQSETELAEPQNERAELYTKNFTMLIKGVLKVNSVTYDKVLIKDISSLFNVQDSVYIIDQFKFKAFDGNMNSSIRYTIRPENKAIVETHHVIQKMDVKKLLVGFDNFEDYYEPSIKAENISGLFSTDLFSRIVMENDSLVQKDIRVKGDLKLENGGVYNFEPATNMSKFTGIDELDNIKFKTLESNIFIFKNAIYVPETFISSNAVDITAYGMQSFGEDYEYHLKIKLSDLLFGKSKKLKRKQSKSGDEAIEDDRSKREIVTYSIDGKNKNGFDNSTLQSAMKNKIVMQEKMLNFRFNPRLVNFETDVYSKNLK